VLRLTSSAASPIFSPPTIPHLRELRHRDGSPLIGRMRDPGNSLVLFLDMTPGSFVCANISSILCCRLGPKHIHAYLSRVMYNRRSKSDPLWNSLVIAGFANGESYLGTVDLIATQFEDDVIATGCPPPLPCTCHDDCV
jgi:hypothetical protein